MKIFKLYKASLCLLALVVAATLLRFVLISNNWPATNSDEATIDLMALHILTRGEHPIFFYGQPYMGSFEAYIGALCFRLFGISVFSLRLGLLPILAGFLVSLYFLTSLLYSKRLALIVVALLALGSNDSIYHQFIAIGGYPETLLFGTLIFLLSSLLVLSRQYNHNRRTWIYAILGLLIGFSFYTDPLDAPLIAVSILLLCVFCWRELYSQRGILLLAMIFVGMSPLIIYNLQHIHDVTTFNFYIDMQQSGTQRMQQQHLPAIQKPVGALLITLPTALGVTPSCPAQAIPLFGPASPSTIACVIWQGSWTLGYWSLWTLATVLTVQTLRRMWQGKKQIAPLLADPQFAKQVICLMLLFSTALSFVLYINNPESALSPLPTTRYLICMLIGTPALLWPLWRPFERREYRYASALRLLCALLLLFIGASTAYSTSTIFSGLKNTAAFYQQQNELIAQLDKHTITRIYSDYWTCNRLIFGSDERILCSSLNEQLGPGQDRYLPYHQAVRAATHPAYVFRIDSPQAKKLARLFHERHFHGQQLTCNGYVIYQVA
ncbi:MAG TPA: hypothetical protein VGN34_12740 [Ktedonobacteraceae bacterium]|jgi:hypothetical protein